MKYGTYNRLKSTKLSAKKDITRIVEFYGRSPATTIVCARTMGKSRFMATMTRRFLKDLNELSSKYPVKVFMELYGTIDLIEIYKREALINN